MFVGKTVNYLPSCHSTNDIAHSLVESGSPIEGTVIITDNQTAGRGQQGSKWESEPFENLTFSIVLKPKIDPKNQFDLNIIISLAITEALNYFLPGSKVQIKWPNDIYIDDKKICGILIQNIIRGNKIHSSIIGIGINVNQTKFDEPKATSIKRILNEQLEKEPALEVVLEKIEKFYLLFNDQKQLLFNKYLNKLLGLGEPRIFCDKENLQFEGIITGIDEQGRLLVLINNSVKIFNFKEIKFL